MRCECVILNRKPNESQRDWLKRIMCQFHWMETDYYREKITIEKELEREPKQLSFDFSKEY